MILQCPSCNARFLIADALIPPAGRTVRCGACKHEWFVEPAVPADAAQITEPATTEPVPPVEHAIANEDTAPANETPLADTTDTVPPPPATPHQLPVVAKPKLPVWPFVTAASVVFALWLLLGFFAYFPSLHRAPVLDAIYRAAGTINTNSLVFNEVKMERVEIEGRTHYVLSGSIANHAYKSRLLPKVRVELKDKKGKVIWSRTYPVNQVIKPGEIYPFRIEDIKTSFAGSVSTVVMDLGNSLELMMR